MCRENDLENIVKNYSHSSIGELPKGAIDTTDMPLGIRRLTNRLLVASQQSCPYRGEDGIIGKHGENPGEKHFFYPTLPNAYWKKQENQDNNQIYCVTTRSKLTSRYYDK